MPRTLPAIQTERQQIAAARDELRLQVKRRELIDVERLRFRIIELAHAVRELLLLNPHRQGATLAAQHGLDPGNTIMALNKIIRAALTAVAKEGRSGLQQQ